MTTTPCHQGQMNTFSDMKHSQPHISLYQASIIFSCGGNMLRKVGSLMVMLSSASLESFSPPYSGGRTIIECSSITDT